MRILHTIYDDPWNTWLAGGGALRTLQISRRLVARHDITILTGRYPGAPETENRDGIRFHRVGSQVSYALSRLSFSIAASRHVQKADFDLWVYSFSAFAPLCAAASHRQTALLECFHLMGSHAEEKHPFVGRTTRHVESATLRAYPNVLTISPSVRDAIVDIRGSHGLHVVYTGVDDECFVDPLEEEDYILYFGRLDPYTKGLDILLRAFARQNSDIQLKIAGRGSPEARAELERATRELEISQRVEFLGSVTNEQRSDLYRRCLFFCTPSRYEGWCIAAVEAAAASRPVLGTRIPGLKDAVRDGETGILVQPEDVDALAAAMQRLLSNTEERARLGRAGRKWAENFTWDRIATDQEKVYESIT